MSEEYDNITNEKIDTLMLDEDDSEVDDSEADDSRLTQNIKVTLNNNIKDKSLSNNDMEDIGGMHRLEQCCFLSLFYVYTYVYAYVLCTHAGIYTYIYIYVRCIYYT